LAIGLPFVVLAMLYIRRLVAASMEDLREAGVDPEVARLRGVAELQAVEQGGFHPRQWLVKKAMSWGWRHLT
jgi:hypothetical protein